MNGGVLHAKECMTNEELTDAEVGYRYFGLDDVALLLARSREAVGAADVSGSHGQQLDREYLHLVPSDSSLSERFEIQLKSSPADFAPLRPNDGS